MQPSVFCLAQGIFHNELPDEAQVSEFNDFSGWAGGFPHHVHFVLEQVESTLCTLQPLVRAYDAHFFGHGANQTDSVVIDGRVFP